MMWFLSLFNLQKFIHELGHLWLAKRAGIVVEEFGVGYPPRAAEFTRRKGTIYTLNWLPVGSFVRMLGEKDPSIPGSFASKSKLTRLSILAIGPLLNLITTVTILVPPIVFFTLAYMVGITGPVTGVNIKGQQASVATTVIVDVERDSPAEKAGLQTGDIVVGADELEFKYVDDFSSYVQRLKGRETVLHIRRENELIHVPIIPRVNPPPGQGGLGVGLVYEDIESKITRYSLPEAVSGQIK